MHRPCSDTDLAEVLTAAGNRGVLARGLGRAYGDAAQNAGGVVFDLTGWDRVLALDLPRGRVTVEAGLSFDSLIRTVLPLGFFPVVTPGTRYVTVGGAIAADVHGKNHHVDGSLGDHVVSLDLMLADGSVRAVGPADELFWATVGGMGLTGVIVRATLQLRPAPTSSVVVDTQRCRSLDDLLAAMCDHDGDYTYSVAWVDCLSSGADLGRSVLTRANPAGLEATPARRCFPVTDSPGRADRAGPAGRRGPFGFAGRPPVTVPPVFPDGLLNRRTVGAFNELWYRLAPSRRRGEVQGLGRFLYPLDGLAQWNRVYGPSGFLQYQLVVPFEAEAALQRCLELVSAQGQGCFLAVLKRLGPAGRGLLSFPTSGWTLTLDMPGSEPRVGPLMDRLDDIVLAAGGRIYLAKDSRMAAADVPAMYPHLEQWRRVRAAADPGGRFQSDLGRRLRL